MAPMAFSPSSVADSTASLFLLLFFLGPSDERTGQRKKEKRKRLTDPQAANAVVRLCGQSVML